MCGCERLERMRDDKSPWAWHPRGASAPFSSSSDHITHHPMESIHQGRRAANVDISTGQDKQLR